MNQFSLNIEYMIYLLTISVIHFVAKEISNIIFLRTQIQLSHYFQIKSYVIIRLDKNHKKILKIRNHTDLKKVFCEDK